MSEIQKNVLEQEPSDDVKVYVAWVPMFRGMERDVPEATRSLSDPRTRHYWDGDSLLVKSYRHTLALSEDAWDVFLLYDRQARWEGDTPPTPVFWMHQLGSRRKPRVHGPWLDAATFLRRTRDLLTTTRP